MKIAYVAKHSVVSGHFNYTITHRLGQLKTNDFKTIGLMQKYPPIFKKMVLNDVALLWMRGFHAYDTASVSS